MTNKRKILILGVCLCVAVFVAGGLLFSKIYRHEKWQSEQLHSLADQMQYIQEEKTQLILQISDMQAQIELLHNKVEYSDDAYNYLAIGNSITRHGLTDYWWNEIGMAATTADNDYVHLVADYLQDTYGDVCYYAVNFYKWENQAHDRAETYEDINPYLSSKIDLVTIQLSENVSDTTTFESDFEALINYIRNNAPKAVIYVIGDFWDSGDKESMKIDASTNTGVTFISLDEIKGNPEYQCGLGTIVYDVDGNKHIVEHEGVAGHPGDKGMKFIADSIIEALKASE